MASEPNAQAYPLYMKGVEAFNAKQYTTAYRALIASCAADPTYSGTWWFLGVLLQQTKQHAQSAVALTRALAAFGPEAGVKDRAKVLAHLALSQHCAGQHAQSWVNIQRARSLDPESALAWQVSSQIEMCFGEGKRAIESARRASELSDDWSIDLQLGFVLMSDGQLIEGLKYFEVRIAQYMPDMLEYGYPFWDGSHVGTLSIQAEQGLGDAIQYMRFIPEACTRADKVVYLVHKELLRFSQDVLGHIENLEIYPMPATVPFADSFAPIVSLPMMLGLDMEAATAAKHQIDFDQHNWGCGPTKRIGIVWAGNASHDNDRLRSIPVETFLPLCELPNVQLYSLQVGPRGGDLNEAWMYGFIEDLSPHLMDVQSTASFIEDLDLVICCDTAVAHLAGSMGKPTFMMINQHGRDFRWGPDGSTTLWYPSMRIFRRGLYETWADVMGRVVDAVRKIPTKEIDQ